MTRLLLTFAAVLAFCAAPSDAQLSSWGFDHTRPSIVGNETPRNDRGDPFGWIGMTGETCAPGIVLGRGTLTAAAHEIQDGSFSLSHGARPVLSVTLPRGAVALLRAQEAQGREVELVLREIPPRILKEIGR